MVIQVAGLTKVYGQKVVVDNIDFSVYNGEIFGFLGRNGAGKSTTINMITGIVKPTAGTITLFESGNISKQLRKRVGVLPDSSNYYNDLTAYQHIKLFCSIKGVRSRKKEIYELLNQVGLDNYDKKKVASFSLGMKKKLGLAQALIGNPDLLFLDEPTSTLDPESAILIRDLIQSLAENGKTIFMTSHNLDEVEKICDRIAIMEHGKIVKLGSLSWLRKNAQSNLKVIIHSKQHPRDSQEYVTKVSGLGIQIQAKGNGFLLVVDSDEHIPGLISLAVHQNIRIYGVEVEQLSLEEIFLSKKARS